ncbi:MAG: ribonuclease P protein component [Candidatus Schekmanbacteria bacterium]|nr:ribonuclease P protein component [Candidatus Schekmanbacteria bacterium]
MASPIPTIRRGASFKAVFAEGRRYYSDLLVYVLLRRAVEPVPNDVAPLRVGYAVTKRHGGVVRRNRVRRCLREAIRVLPVRRSEPAALVLIAKREAFSATFHALMADVEQGFARMRLLDG